ncbi:MAG: aspartate kinase [Clostridia bacterium]|nr:aspartate kinase [Clostridia bacterium]
MITVVKFGGSSVASATQFNKVKNIVKGDEKRQAVVVSALGKRNKEDSKITDLLYVLSSHIKYAVDYSNVFNEIYFRYNEVRSDLGLKYDISADFDAFKENLKNGATEEYIVSRGEYLCAKLMANYLGYAFVDAADVIRFNYDGTLNYEKTKELVKAKYEEVGAMVVPGFYGSFPTGEIKLFSRGGSDITGSLLAMALEAEKYENWTDVSGVLMADPRIVNNPKRIAEVTYDELRELSYMGASVLHEETIFPIRELGIPINILNTNAPNDEGTAIIQSSSLNDGIITGISGKKNYKAFTIAKAITANKSVVIRKCLEVFEHFKIAVEHIPTAIDKFNVIVDGKKVEKKLYDIIGRLKEVEGVVSVDVDGDLALVAVVGRNMALKPGMSGLIFSIFGKNNINIKTIAQSTEEISIIVGVAEADFEKAINAIYDGIVR